MLETGLVDAVVDDAGREPGVLPLLSTAMSAAVGAPRRDAR